MFTYIFYTISKFRVTENIRAVFKKTFINDFRKFETAP